MKNILILISFIITANCNAQTILSLYDGERDIQGAYYKDLNNDLNNFVGTWKYANGTTSLTIILQKKEMQNHSYSYNNISYYEDIIVGGYQYIENGIEKINTLSQLSINLPKSYDYHIAGNIILPPAATNCLGCISNMRIVHLGFTDPNRSILGMESRMMFARADSGGVQKLLLKFRALSGGLEDPDHPRPYNEYTVPFGEYLLVKQ
ncbi:DUF6705 family protein [Flavobacterium sp.]|uniref:DUF6705 family protein n=1 Tax=Flavobacterium sp. TaxID=239 RepID=UPI004033C09A